MSDREKARERALAAARAVTLGLAIAATASGCEQVADRACRFSFAENTHYCCERSGGHYDAPSGTCMFPVMGPFVPPDLPSEASV